MNTYGYVGGNPLGWIDPFGLEKIVIDLSEDELTLYDDNGKELFDANIVHGCEGFDTPKGEFKAGFWQFDKTNSKYGATPWSKDSSNPYGPWFLRVNDLNGKYTTIGIHGTAGPGWNPLAKPPFSSLFGEFAGCSHGCVRISNPNIKELQNLIPKPQNTTIIVKE